MPSQITSKLRNLLVLALPFLAGPTPSRAQDFAPTNNPSVYGPYNAVIFPDGEGLKKTLVKNDTVLRADSPWSLSGWVWWIEAPKGPSLIAGVGDCEAEYSRYLGIDGDKLLLWTGKDSVLSATPGLVAGKWHFLAATFDAKEYQLFADGNRIASGRLDQGRVSAILQLAPVKLPWTNGKHFGGKIAGLTLQRKALSADELRTDFQKPEDFTLLLFEEGSKPWPVQTSAQAGYRVPQDPGTMPRSKAEFPKPQKKSGGIAANSIEAIGKNQWLVQGGWRLRPAPAVKEPGEAISQSEFSAREWWPATVPGTALTTMIDQGIYLDPDYGLNNLAIPESLNKQDYWYRTEFRAPKDWKGRRLTLTFEGINYTASVWLNGKNLGLIKGAFIRGRFDITNAIKQDQSNVLAVRVSPPPHPGIPHEQSIRAGAGENGGIMCLDGPTFVDTEGWDWIPAIRDRDTGIWQPVTIRTTGGIRIGDTQVVTKLPLPETNRATVEITVPLENQSPSTIRATVNATFANVRVTKTAAVAPGENEVKFSAGEFPQLNVENPRLWWPNGYGKPELYTLKVSASEGNRESDSKELRFGIREVTYELGLFDSTGNLRRVEISPTAAREKKEQIVDVTHQAIRPIALRDPMPTIYPPEWDDGWKSWAASLTPGAERSSAVKPVEDTRAGHYLTLKVNGVRIAARGGSWGMDDSRKRVSRERLEPYFRLHHDANVNIIRNWVGQSTEETFYELADEYGLLVWNDFWASTQGYNLEPEDPVLFLENARDTILRFRNHPSIVMWCGRNEGVPQPVLNEGLDDLIRTVDGTRYYTPTSNQVNLQNSGPYHWVDPKLYFTMLNHGFSVETGTPSFPTLEMWRAWIPQADQWPISDAWAYHDWHQDANGDTAPFMAEMEKEFGAPTSLEDFERKAQMINFVQHRAIFEGMNAHLWEPNTGRMLWMTQPAWPSTNWQILSSDYDTQASFYAVMHASEMLHVQLDPTTNTVQVVNSLPVTTNGLTVHAKMVALDNAVLFDHEQRLDAMSGTTNSFALDSRTDSKDDMVLVKLELRNSDSKLVSENFYWLSGDSANFRKLNRLAPAQLAITANSSHEGDEVRLHIRLENIGSAPAIQTKLTVLDADGHTRILPAYYSDNYISLFGGETKQIEISVPKLALHGGVAVALRGWNVVEKTVNVALGAQ